MTTRPFPGRLTFLGTPSAWAKQFLGTLQQTGSYQIEFATLESIASTRAPRSRVLTLVLENNAGATSLLEQVRKSGRKAVAVWIGQDFSKDDLAFALEHRVYAVLKNPQAGDPAVEERIRAAVDNSESTERAGDILLSVKTADLEVGREIPESPTFAELRTSVAKLERTAMSSEFVGPVAQANTDGHLIFHKSQTLADALMTVQDLERTGTLVVHCKADGRQGKVDFIQGRPTDAWTGDIRGVKAIYRMFLWDGLEFQFLRHDATETRVDTDFQQSLRDICAEGERLRERYEQIRGQLPPAQIRLELDPTSLHAGADLDRPTFLTLSSVVELGAVSRILDFNPLPDVVLYESLIALKRAGLIRVAA